MSRIDDMLKEHCPNGVEFKRVGEVTTRGSNIRWASASDREFRYIDLSSVDRGTRRIGETATITRADAPSRAQQIVRTGDVIFATTRPTQMRWAIIPPEFDGQIASTGYCVLRPDAEQVLTNFLAHLLGSDNFKRYIETNQVPGNYPSIPDSRVRAYKIPVPPPAIQREIAEILDKMELLKAELEAELELRSRQYGFYRDALLAFTGAIPQSVRWVQMGELLREPLANGRSVPDGVGYPVLRLTALHGPVVDVSQRKLGAWDAEAGRRFRIKAGDLLIVRGNGSKDLIARACMVETSHEVAFPDTMIRVRPDLDLVSQRYLFYIWESSAARAQLQRAAKLTSGVWKVSQADLSGVMLPVPPLEEQARIVAILDKFDALVNDLSAGLPAEIAARQKQYEYYRDRLLTFEEAS